MPNNSVQEMLLEKIAQLESKLDLLETEVDFLNNTLIDCGFPEGISTLKQSISEILEEKSQSI